MKQNKRVYQHVMTSWTDIVEHLGILRGLAMQCNHVVEFGLRTGMSTSVMLDGTKCKVTSYDIAACTQAVQAMRELAPTRFTFIRGDSTKVSIETCDMLFIDSQHDYATLARELFMHHKQVKRWISMHDTHTFATKGMTAGDPGLQKAIDEFLRAYPEWRLQLHLPNQNGFTLLERV